MPKHVGKAILGMISNTVESISTAINIVDIYVQGRSERAQLSERIRIKEAEADAINRIIMVEQSSAIELAKELEMIQNRINNKELYEQAQAIFDSIDLDKHA